MSLTPIYVTQPFLPPLDEFTELLRKIWENKILTNNGPYHEQLEQALCEYLGVRHLSLFTNGTIALVTALQALRVSGEVITTPYSFVATSHALLWNNIKPVFVDIAPGTFNLDPDRIEEAITPSTTAIMPVHCYGKPCDVERISKIADTYGLKVIFDAAHAFGVTYKDKSVLTHGDMSVLSFHATKVFNTFEGGAIICQDDKTRQRINYLKNFGFADEVTVTAPGINGKMSEINAAFGLLQLRYVDTALARRIEIQDFYRRALTDVPGIELLPDPIGTASNAAYFPVLITRSFPITRDSLYQLLKDQGIHGRRYFYPLISDMPMYRGLPSARRENLPQATITAQQVLCLPIYPALEMDTVAQICKLIVVAAKS